jgi:DNA-binding MltR family transcriptional regulator
MPLSLFKDTPAAIKALRKSYKDHRMPDMFQLQIDLSRETDRSSIILMASLLDNALATRIAKSLCFSPNGSEFDYMFRFEGPMGTFSAKMEIACIFGVIEDATYAQLNIIREMRNACAHSRDVLTFADPTLSTVAKRLALSDGITPFLESELDRPELIKLAFILEGFFVLQSIFDGRKTARGKILKMIRERPLPPEPLPDKSPKL